ncbi:MAG: NTP transferase domain-containing protein [Xanthomonadales bacterium]|nr:nucleotidyltransferase family protein [Gammaproteobacteria bacterium]NNL05076.1 NTP transferase domain-containing protein [Xanthomonadales bacterium]
MNPLGERGIFNLDMTHEPDKVLPAYPDPLDAIVLAGTDDNPRRMIKGQNKAFLEIGTKPLVRRVAEALLDADSVGRIFVVGPLERLQAALAGLPDRVQPVAQVGKVIANAWAAIHAAEAWHLERHDNAVDVERPWLVLSSDLPLISPEAVDDFVARCTAVDGQSREGNAMLCGVAEEASLRQYYPGDGRPGIKRPYVNYADCRIRLANIYVGRPRKLTNQRFLQTGFEHRKAAKLKNVLALAWDFLSQPAGWKAAWLSLRMQATLMAERSGSRFYPSLRAGNSLRVTEEVTSKVLGGPIRVVITPYGELSLDADNEEDFQVLNDRFDEWKTYPPVDS